MSAKPDRKKLKALIKEAQDIIPQTEAKFGYQGVQQLPYTGVHFVSVIYLVAS